jgi:hypothetical protein
VRRDHLETIAIADVGSCPAWGCGLALRTVGDLVSCVRCGWAGRLEAERPAGT